MERREVISVRASRSTLKRAMIVSALPKPENLDHGPVCRSDITNWRGFVFNQPRQNHLHHETLKGESVIHFGEDETLHIGMKPQEFIERAG